VNVDVYESLLLGLTLGLSAGFSPGPILALVIGETLSGGFRNGLKVAAAPLLTDGPIILACVLVLSTVSDSRQVLGSISLAGGVYLVKLGLESFKAPAPEAQRQPGADSLKKAVIANFLNPNPYLFWLTVGSPILLSGSKKGSAAPALFLAGFYLCLVGSKIGLAAAAARSRHIIRGQGYRVVLWVLGAALIIFAALFIDKGLSLLLRA
jgi:threonine/homoserine/homoserine lactone efflux protein